MRGGGLLLRMDLFLVDGLVPGIYDVGGIDCRSQLVHILGLDLINPLQHLSQILATVNVPSFQLRALQSVVSTGPTKDPNSRWKT